MFGDVYRSVRSGVKSVSKEVRSQNLRWTVYDMEELKEADFDIESGIPEGLRVEKDQDKTVLIIPSKLNQE
jgi:effector-binding domain-containing protein